MATVDHDKEISAMTIGPESLGGEMQTIHPSLAIIVDVECVYVLAGQPSGGKRAKGADVFVMIAGDKVVSKVANLRFSGQKQLVRGRRGREVVLNLRGKAERFGPNQSGDFVDAFGLWSHRVAGRWRGTEKPRRCCVQ